MPELTVDEVLHLKPGTVVFVVSRAWSGVTKVTVGRTRKSYGGHACVFSRERPKSAFDTEYRHFFLNYWDAHAFSIKKQGKVAN